MLEKSAHFTVSEQRRLVEIMKTLDGRLTFNSMSSRYCLRYEQALSIPEKSSEAA